MAKKKSILFLFPYPQGSAASQRFRFEQYLDDLEEQGFELDFQSFLDQKTWDILYEPGHYFAKLLGIFRGFLRRFWLLFRAHRYEYIFIHRELSPIGPPIVEWLLAKVWRKKIIFDYDDAIWLANTSENNFFVARLKFHQKTRWICAWAYKVSAGNDYLADYARNFNPRVIVNPTTIDTENWHNQIRNQDQDETLVIGWTGTHSTLKYLDPLLPLLKKLEEKFSFTFLVICNQPPSFSLDSLQYLPWKKESEIEDLLKMHVGLMPLSEDPWSKGKCGFKALQYMALGIPPLLSPVGVNEEIVQSGENGWVCKEPADWEAALSTLIQQPQLRSELGRKARESIIAHYSVLSNQINFRELFS